MNKGLLLVFLTAIISGFSIFINSIAVAGMNAFWFTTIKNLIVAIALFGLILGLKEAKKLLALTKKQLIKLLAISFTGGSTAFLLFFYALKESNAVNAGFIHKTLFVFVTILALIFLKERLSKSFLIGATLLFIGNLIIFSGILKMQFNFFDFLILIATILWAIENVIAKNVLKELNGTTVAFARMFFGSIIMLAFLFLSGNQINLTQISIENIYWIILTALLLFFYVFFWYNGLKLIEAHKATAILSFGQIITAMLSIIFKGKTIEFNEAIGLTLILFGLIIIIGFTIIIEKIGIQSISLAKNSKN